MYTCKENCEELFHFIVICIVYTYYTTLFSVIQIYENYMYHYLGLQDETKHLLQHLCYYSVHALLKKKNEIHFPTNEV